MKAELVLAVPMILFALLTAVLWVLAGRRATSEKEIVSDRVEVFVSRKE